MMDKEVLHQVYLGLGSNLGDRRALLESAIRLIGERIGSVTKRSSFIETEPWGFASENRFLNAVVCCETEKTPREVLRATQKIERELGKSKAHATKRSHPSSLFPLPSSLFPLHSSLFTLHSSLYKDRPIDIDILLYDDLTVDEPDLQIPHPLMQERDFVMIPLREIKPQ